jgi:hypothetical protein
MTPQPITEACKTSLKRCDERHFAGRAPELPAREGGIMGDIPDYPNSSPVIKIGEVTLWSPTHLDGGAPLPSFRRVRVVGAFLDHDSAQVSVAHRGPES